MSECSRGIINESRSDNAGHHTAMLSSLDTIYYSWDAAGRMTMAESGAGVVSFT
jgi:hypothetical protein